MAYAQSLEEIKADLEIKIQEDKHLEDVILNFNHPNVLNNHDDIDFLHMMYDPKPNTVKVFVKLNEQEHSFYGHFEKAVLLPALIEKVEKGHIITEDLFTIIKYPKSKNIATYVKNIEHVIGKSAKRHLLPMKPLRISDFKTPTLINKGKKVTLIFKKNKLVIESLGIALEDGGASDVIKLKNIDSGKVIIGRVVSSELVEVGGAL